jgi:hypothetical protein
VRPERPQFKFLQAKRVQNDSRNHQESYRVRIEDPFTEVKCRKGENQRQPLNKMPSDNEDLSKKKEAAT